jgi:adenylylsulfate kinase
MTVVWITGLPSSGKSTLAARLQRRLANAIVLDGDEVRDVLGMHAYDSRGRYAFYRALSGLSALIARQGVVAIVPATAPSREHRAVARELAPRFLEVFVDTPLDECERRDSKGLYAAARRGAVTALPGGAVEYERPSSPDVIAQGGEDDLAIARILDLLRASPIC